MADPVFNNSPPIGRRDTPYEFTFDITADSPPLTQVVGELPPGLALSENEDSYNPVISGTPSAFGVYNFSVVAKTSEGFAVKDFVITIRNQNPFRGFYG